MSIIAAVAAAFLIGIGIGAWGTVLHQRFWARVWRDESYRGRW